MNTSTVNGQSNSYYDSQPEGTRGPRQLGDLRQLRRSRDDRMVAGVCGGVGRYLGVDPTIVRITLVVLTVLGMGSTLLAYAIAWILIPEDEPAWR